MKNKIKNIIGLILVIFLYVINLQAQSPYHFDETGNISCIDPVNQLKIDMNLDIDVDMVYLPNEECGTWQFDLSYTTSGTPLVTSLVVVDWVNVTGGGIGVNPNQMYNTVYGETEHGYSTRFHISESGITTIKLFFKVRLLPIPPYTNVCGDTNFEFEYDITQPHACDDACNSAFCYSHTFCYDPPSQPYVNQLKTIYYYEGTDPAQKTLSASTNPGNMFNFPYGFHTQSLYCWYSPDLYDFVDDMNDFLDWRYGQGTCVLQYVEGSSLCKIWVKVKGCDFKFDYVYNESFKIDHNCTTIQFLCPSVAGGYLIDGGCLNPEVQIRDNEVNIIDNNESLDWEIRPSLATSNIRVIFNTNTSDMKEIKIFDSSGFLHFTGIINPEEWEYEIDIEIMPKGLYFVYLNNGSKSSVKKITKI